MQILHITPILHFSKFSNIFIALFTKNFLVYSYGVLCKRRYIFSAAINCCYLTVLKTEGLMMACNKPQRVAWSTYVWCYVWLYTGSLFYLATIICHFPTTSSQRVWEVGWDVSRLCPSPSSRCQGVTSNQATTFLSNSLFTHQLSIDTAEPKLLAVSLSKVQINMASKKIRHWRFCSSATRLCVKG
jgi:hypothetical protein